jgi:predicted thioesterase
MRVKIEATVIAVERRTVTFEVVASDALEECGRATHVRFVVDNEKRSQRLADKRARTKVIEKEAP